MASLVSNKKAHFDYEILEKFESGIELFGHEVKSIMKGQASLEGAHVTIRGGEAFLIGASVPAYQPNNTPKEYDSLRNRKLLLTRKELATLAGTESQKGLTIVPLSMYSKGRKIKVELASVRGKKQFDKRESIKKRESKRDIERTLKTK